ncbi:MAG: SurA N-terminal domain-containing protein, partial [Candidatus Cryptobacteroides sp.]
MAVLETIRVKFGVLISVLIAVALLSFIIDPTTLQNVASSMSSKYDVGEIDGKSISYTDYQKDVEKTKGVMELLGFQANTEQAQAYVRDEAWKELFDKYYFIPNAEDAGIYVGDQEALDLISGDNISPVIAQMFSDENGFNREAFLNFVDYCRNDQSGRYRELLNYLCNAAISQQYYAKYFSLFSASNITNELDIRKEIADNNNSVNAEFVMVPFGYARDTTVKVSDDEIKAWYKSHKKVAAYKDLLTRKASRDIEYVVYDILPSAEDIAEANDEIASLVDDFANTSNVKSFLSANYCSFDEKYYKEGELKSIAPEIDQFVFNNGGKDVSGVIARGNDFYVVR